MCQHVCNGCAFCTDKGDTQVGCRPKYDSTPSLANMRKLIPPSSAVPSPAPPYETTSIALVFAQKKWSIEMEYVEKRVIIEDVD